MGFFKMKGSDGMVARIKFADCFPFLVGLVFQQVPYKNSIKMSKLNSK